MASKLDVADDALHLIDEVIRLAGRLTTARKMATEVAGMRTAHWLVLTAICRAPAPTTVARIARSFGHSRQGVQRIADALEEQGMIRFVENELDRRARLLVPTTKGSEAHALADGEGRAWASDLTSKIPPADIALTVEVLAKLRREIENQGRKG